MSRIKRSKFATDEEFEAAKEKYRAYQREKQREWRKANPEKARSATQTWDAANPEKKRAAVNAWKDANPERVHLHERRKALANHGLTIEDYDRMLAAQGGVCAICGSSDPGGGPRKKYFCIDHDHAIAPGMKHRNRNAVRALLCVPCNTILGHAADDPKILIAAADYLRRFKEKSAA